MVEGLLSMGPTPSGLFINYLDRAFYPPSNSKVNERYYLFFIYLKLINRTIEEFRTIILSLKLAHTSWRTFFSYKLSAHCANVRQHPHKTVSTLLCTLPGQRPGIAEGNERTRLGRVHLYFFLLFDKL